MRFTARRFAENWLDEHTSETDAENASAKDVSDLLIGAGEAQGISAEDFNDDQGCLLEMVRASIARGSS